MLLEEETSVFTKTKETDAIDTGSVLKILKEEAVTINAEAVTDADPVTPKITTRVDA